LPDVGAGSRAILSTGNTTNLCDHNNDNKKPAKATPQQHPAQQQLNCGEVVGCLLFGDGGVEITVVPLAV